MKKLNFDFVETVTRDDKVIFVENQSSMIEIGNDIYSSVADELRKAIGDAGFFNGSIEVDSPEFYSTFTGTLLIYRREDILPEGPRRIINDVVPVWWEFSTAVPPNEDMMNDFCFSELKARLIEPA